MYQNTCSYVNHGCALAEQYEKKKRRRGIKLIALLLVVCLLLGVVSVVGSEESAPHEPYIAVLDIMGTISENDGNTYDQQYLLNSVEELLQDDYNKGLILHIDSPGGAVYQIDELYLKLMEYKEVTQRPVYAAIESYAASGGYYEACAADKIYANRNAITGSIGVIMGEFLDVSRFLDDLGVEVSYVTSGANKAMGNIYQPMTAEQKAIYQSICDESYNQFLDIIVQSRGMEEKAVRQLADGRIYTASQALQNGLIDGIEPFQDTLDRLKTDLGYDKIAVWQYSYQAPAGLWDYMASGNIQKLAEKLTGESDRKLLETQEPPQVMMYFNGY